MKKKRILYLIRAEADLERIVAIAQAGREKANQKFIYFGDNNYIFESGIQNIYQKHLLVEPGFKVVDAVTLIFSGKLYKYLAGINVNNRYAEMLVKVLIKIPNRFIYIHQDKLAARVLKKFKPDILITDNAVEKKGYFPAILRKTAIQLGIKVHITGHGPAGGLHREYSTYQTIRLSDFEDCEVGICSEHDYGFGLKNRVVTGDPADSFPLVQMKNQDDFQRITFHNDRKYRIGFFMAAPFETCTNGWSVMEEIMLDLAFRDDVVMIAKFHPRLYKTGDYRYLPGIENLKLYGSELDRSRLTQWANIVVCSDHCSTIFEPMILGKKVVAIHSKKVRPFASYVSPVHDSDPSINSIYHAEEFDLEGLQTYTDNQGFIDEYCWGGHGQVDLGESILNKLLENDD